MLLPYCTGQDTASSFYVFSLLKTCTIVMQFSVRATDEGSLPEIVQYSPHYLPLNVLLLPKDQTFIFFAITAAGVVPCGAPKKSPRTSSIVQIIFYLGPLRSVKIFRVFKTLTFRYVLLSNV